jgi:hypothetical protein
LGQPAARSNWIANINSAGGLSLWFFKQTQSGLSADLALDAPRLRAAEATKSVTNPLHPPNPFPTLFFFPLFQKKARNRKEH